MALPDNYRLADTEKSGRKRTCGNCGYLQRYSHGVLYCKRWRAIVKTSYVCNAWKSQ